jgi:hypothetical protein
MEGESCWKSGGDEPKPNGVIHGYLATEPKLVGVNSNTEYN